MHISHEHRQSLGFVPLRDVWRIESRTAVLPDTVGSFPSRETDLFVHKTSVEGTVSIAVGLDIASSFLTLSFVFHIGQVLRDC